MNRCIPREIIRFRAKSIGRTEIVNYSDIFVKKMYFGLPSFKLKVERLSVHNDRYYKLMFFF